MTDHFKFAEPIEVENIEKCYFYHCMNIPSVGQVGGDWDLRQTVDYYLGKFDFSGKRALDVGTASGFLTFEMEKRGAEVVSFDMSTGFQWDLVPHYKLQRDWEEYLKKIDSTMRQLKNGYWYAHQRLKSKAKAYYGDIYQLPDGLGTFDVVFFGMILSHLRDPFNALYSACRLSRNSVIITNQTHPGKEATIHFLPKGRHDPDKTLSTARVWWAFSDGCIEEMLGVLGFELERIIKHSHTCVQQKRKGLKECTTFVARRISGGVF